MKNGQNGAQGQTAGRMGGKAAHAADPDMLSIDLVRKVMEKSGLQSESGSEENRQRRKSTRDRLAEARKHRISVQAEKAAKPAKPGGWMQNMITRVVSYRPAGNGLDKQRQDPFDRLAAQTRES